MGIKPSPLGCSGGGVWNGGGLATTSLEFEFCLQFSCGFPSTELSDFHQSVGSRACKLQMYFRSLLLSLWKKDATNLRFPLFMKMSCLQSAWSHSVPWSLISWVGSFSSSALASLNGLASGTHLCHRLFSLYTVQWCYVWTVHQGYNVQCWLKGFWPFVCLLSFH